MFCMRFHGVLVNDIASMAQDPVLLILLGAVFISLLVGMINDYHHGWHESLAIFVSVSQSLTDHTQQ